MHKASLLVVLIVGSGCFVRAQTQTPSPRPAGETAQPWTPVEAQAMAVASRLAAAWRGGTDGGGAGDPRQGPMSGYTVQMVWQDAKNEWRFERDLRSSGGPGASREWLCYVAPDGSDEAAKRIFCMRSDGCVAFTDNTAGTGRSGGRELVATDVLARGGKDTLGDYPRTPTVGSDGNLWMPADLAPRATLRVTVVGENGQRLGGIGVATMVVARENAIDAPLPAGFARTLREGDAELQGVPARGLGFVLTIDRSNLPLPPSAVRVEGNTARLTVSTRVLQQGRTRANEAAAIATLKNISSAQAQCQASGAIDANKNGAGEYGTFAELTGREVVRGGTLRISPPVLSTAFGKVENGVVTRSGYCYRMVLPGKGGAPVPELANGGCDATAIDAAQAETQWCCYAWPLEAGATGARCFFVNQAGDVLACDNADGRYSGAAKGPGCDAAFAAGSDGKLGAAAAANGKARDGQTWSVLP